LKAGHGTITARLTAALASLIVLATGCTQEDPTTPEPTGGADESPQATASEVTFKTTEYAFNVPASFAGGLSAILLDNSAGKESHEAELSRLEEGRTAMDVLNHFKANPLAAPPAFAKSAGGTGPVLPGQKATYTSVLEPGTYALLCFVSSPDGQFHFQKGMLGEVRVSEGEAGELPEADITIDAREEESEGKRTFSFGGTDDLKSGDQVVKVENKGKQDHFFAMPLLADGKTADDVLKFFTSGGPPSGPPPFADFAGLVGTLPPGGEATRTLNLKPGNYALFCLIPDTDGTPHAAKGMLKQITIG
jgi:uncharacterized cupredoxin-like copper-binding protein